MRMLHRFGLWVVLVALSGAAQAQVLESVLINGGTELPNGVPNYAQQDFPGDKDCGPTAALMLLGYYDANGWSSFVPDSRPYYSPTVQAPSGLDELDGALKKKLHYDQFGNLGMAPSLANTTWDEVVAGAATMDPGAAGWTGDDDEWVEPETIKTELRAGRPMMLCTRLTYTYMVWHDPGYTDDKTTEGADWHWMTVLGFQQEVGAFWVAMRSGWRAGGNSFLWYNWGDCDDLYTVEIVPHGAPRNVSPHILLTHDGGTAALCGLDEAGAVKDTRYYPARSGWTARCYERQENCAGRMLWSGPDGRAELWRLDRNNAVAGSSPSMPYHADPGWEAVDYQKLPDGTGRILWNITETVTVPLVINGINMGTMTLQKPGKAIVWFLNADEIPVGFSEFKNPGARAVGYQRLSNGQAILLWKDAQKNAVLWRTDNTESQMVTAWTYASSSDLSPAGYRVMPDGTHRILWTNPSTGWSRVVKYAPNFTLVTWKWYGPYTGWTARTFCGM